MFYLEHGKTIRSNLWRLEQIFKLYPYPVSDLTQYQKYIAGNVEQNLINFNFNLKNNLDRMIGTIPKRHKKS